jgi:hypothetical protein
MRICNIMNVTIMHLYNMRHHDLVERITSSISLVFLNVLVIHSIPTWYVLKTPLPQGSTVFVKS